MASGGNKTEKPTPQRLKKAREQGQFLSARGLVAAIQFIAVVIVLHYLVSSSVEHIHLAMAALLERSMNAEIGSGEWIVLLRTVLLKTLLPLLTYGAIILLVTTATHLAITKMGFSLARLAPDLQRLNPIVRLRQLPAQNFKSVIEAVLLLGILSLAIEYLFHNYAAQLLLIPFKSAQAGAHQIAGTLDDLLWKAAVLFLVFGAFDFFRQYRRHMATLKMTKQEVKEELKRNEGDPQIKGRIRRLRRDFLRRQMMRDVEKATAVVVNPTHFAVALRYQSGTMSTPVCVAKGKNWLALRIREIALKHEVPIVENPPLARALYDSLTVGSSIPPEFYKAVAEILAYIYRLMGRKLPE